MTTFEIPDDVLPNLDGYLTPQELADVRKDLKELADGVTLLASYAEAKENAMLMRLKGDLTLAIRFEHAAEFVYSKLPIWAKW